RDHVARDRGDVVHRQLAYPPLELSDARANVVLARLGSLVLGVLGEIAVRARRLELLGQPDVQLVLEIRQLFLEPGDDRQLHERLRPGRARRVRGARSRSPRSLRPALAATASPSSRFRISRRTSWTRSASASAAPRRSTFRFLAAVMRPRST